MEREREERGRGGERSTFQYLSSRIVAFNPMTNNITNLKVRISWVWNLNMAIVIALHFLSCLLFSMINSFYWHGLWHFTLFLHIERPKASNYWFQCLCYMYGQVIIRNKTVSIITRLFVRSQHALMCNKFSIFLKMESRIWISATISINRYHIHSYNQVHHKFM